MYSTSYHCFFSSLPYFMLPYFMLPYFVLPCFVLNYSTIMNNIRLYSFCTTIPDIDTPPDTHHNM